MRILHVFDHSVPLQSGYSFRSRSILLEQRRRGWQTQHITGGKQGACERAHETFGELSFYRTLPPGPILGRLPILNQLAISRGLEKRIQQVISEVRPDIIHAHSPALNGLAAVRAGARAGLPVVYEIRAFWEDAAVDHGTSKEDGLRYRATRWLETHVVKRADAVTTICEGLRQDLLGRGIDAERITVIPNAVDADRFAFDSPRDAELERRYGLQDKPVVGFIGSFYAYEGVADIVRALPEILHAVPDLKLLLVGGGPCYDETVGLARELGLGDNIICTGRVPHEEVQRYYSLVDILCYPRKAMRLTDLVTPLKPLEAMAQGKIVVASDVGGHRELIENGKNGILFSTGDSNSLAQSIIRVATERANWPAIKAAGRTFVESERSWRASVGRYEGVYRDAQTRAARR